MTAETIERYYTSEEYLELEDKADFKSEYYDGRIYAMSGATRSHNIIAGNVFRRIGNQLEARPCEAYTGDMRVLISDTGLYTYPDIAVVCGEPQFTNSQQTTLRNPIFLVEVLSPSTESYDRGTKFAMYRRLPSLQTYVLISQDTPRIERYDRQGENWLLTEAVGLEATLSLPSIDCTLSLRDAYDRIDFAATVKPLHEQENSTPI